MVGREINKYRIISKLGEGGMGIVYLAEHISLRRKAAIKFLNPTYTREPEIRLRFLNEAYTLAQLNHNNIVALYDYAETESELFLIMEYIEGYTLDYFIERIYGPIPEIIAVGIFKQILSGFSYAHQKGFIHRDIKPSNIILKSDYTPKILDFGIAKMLSTNNPITRIGDKVGTIIYMSPEQVHGSDIDLRSDIYSLGVTLFEMVTGKKAYDANSLTDYHIQSKILNEPLPLASGIYPGVSRHMEHVIAQATAKSVSDRFQNCEDFAYALDYQTSLNVQSNNNKISLYGESNSEHYMTSYDSEKEEKNNNENDKNNISKEQEISKKRSKKVVEVYKASSKKHLEDVKDEENPYKSLFITVGGIILLIIIISLLVGRKDKVVETTPIKKQITTTADSSFYNNVKKDLINYFNKEGIDSNNHNQKLLYANMDKFVLIDANGSFPDYNYIKFKKYLVDNNYRFLKCTKNQVNDSFNLEFSSKKPVIADLKGQVINNKYNVYEINFTSNTTPKIIQRKKSYINKNESSDTTHIVKIK